MFTVKYTVKPQKRILPYKSPLGFAGLKVHIWNKYFDRDLIQIWKKSPLKYLFDLCPNNYFIFQIRTCEMFGDLWISKYLFPLFAAEVILVHNILQNSINLSNLQLIDININIIFANLFISSDFKIKIVKKWLISIHTIW